MTWNMLMRAPLNIREAVNSVTFAHLRRFKKRNATQQVVVCFRFHHTITIRSTCKYFMWILDPLLILMDLTFADHITDKTGALTRQVGNGGKKSRRTKVLPASDKIGSQIYFIVNPPHGLQICSSENNCFSTLRYEVCIFSLHSKAVLWPWDLDNDKWGLC